MGRTIIRATYVSENKMPSPINENMINKLQQAVESWSNDATAPEFLAREIQEAKALLRDILSILQQQLGISPSPQLDTGLYQDMINQLQSQLNQAQNNLHVANSDLQAAERENTELHSAAELTKEVLERREFQVKDITQQLTTAEHEIEEHVRDNQQLNQLAEEHAYEIEALHIDKAELQSDLNRQRDRENTVKRRSHQLEENQEALEAESGSIRSELKEKEATIENLTQKINTFMKAKAESHEQLSSLIEENTSLHTEVESLAKSVNELEEQRTADAGEVSVEGVGKKIEWQEKAALWLKEIQETTLVIQEEMTSLQFSEDMDQGPVNDELLEQKQAEIQALQKANTLYAGRLRALEEQLAEAEKKRSDLEQETNTASSGDALGV
jgi:hypothetical protein